MRAAGGFSRVEQTLLDGGRGAAVIEQRMEFQELMRQRLIDESALTVNGRTIGENYREARILDSNVIRPFEQPLRHKAGFTILRG